MSACLKYFDSDKRVYIDLVSILRLYNYHVEILNFSHIVSRFIWVFDKSEM